MGHPVVSLTSMLNVMYGARGIIRGDKTWWLYGLAFVTRRLGTYGHETNGSSYN